MKTRTIEVLVGVFVIMGFAALLMLAMRVSNLTRITNDEGYPVVAYFENIGGLRARAPVTVSGVRVGRVTAIGYDPQQFKARVDMMIDPQVNYLPRDTGASIYTAGLLGEQYIALDPGASEETLKTGDEIQYTQSALVLEEIIGDILVKITSK